MSALVPLSFRTMHHTFGNRNRPPAAHSNSMFLNRANFIANGNRIFSDHENGRNVTDKIQAIYFGEVFDSKYIPSIIKIKRGKDNERSIFYFLQFMIMKDFN